MQNQFPITAFLQKSVRKEPDTESLIIECVLITYAKKLFKKQERSYRKQIVRQLRTQHVEGIYDNPVTWKSSKGSLKVTGNGTIG